MTLDLRRRVMLFAVIAVVGLGFLGAYLFYARHRLDEKVRSAPSVPTTNPEALAALMAQPHLFFRSTAIGDTYGKVGVVPLAQPSAPPAMTELACDRVDYANGHGICLTADRGLVTSYGAALFDANLHVGANISLSGTPSRTRVSPDGRYGAVTTFVVGDSYAAAAFSTRTNIIDMAAGKVVSDLEKFSVTKDGQRIQSIDFNFWGVTFAADSNVFYATLGTGGHTYLVKGDVAGRSATVITDGVECPALSPDGTRIAYKKRQDNGIGPVTWRLHVLDLAVRKDTALSETKNTDDQAEWLDNEHVLYSLPNSTSGTAETTTWVVNADGSGSPAVFVADSWSPSVVRT